MADDDGMADDGIGQASWYKERRAQNRYGCVIYLMEKDYLRAKSTKTKFQHYAIREQVQQVLQENCFKNPTLVQSESLPITLQGNLRQLCVIIYAYNGAGKTLTYLIPILNSLTNIPANGLKFDKGKDIQVRRPQALIVVPTETLLAQVYDYLQSYADFYEVTFRWKLKVGRIYASTFEDGHILVGLANKMKTRLSQGGVFDLSELKWVAFDECDMLKEASLQDFTDLLKQITKVEGSPNVLITSATGEKDSFRQFIQLHLSSHNLVEINVYEDNKGLQGVTHFYYSKVEDKDAVIYDILERVSQVAEKPQVIIFFNFIPQLRTFYHNLRQQKNRFAVNDSQASSQASLKVEYIHRECSSVCMPNREQHIHPYDCSNSKTDRITRLKNREVQIMLGTDVIGRGIDIRTVTLVINYSEPLHNREMSSTSYIHRVGRTGRYSDQGIALTFVGNPVFVKMAEKEQKIVFQAMPSLTKLLQLTVDCWHTNQPTPQQRE